MRGSSDRRLSPDDLLMDAASYDRWYETPRGQWVGEAEYRLISRSLEPRPGDSLLDVGCGTGWFTRRFFRSGLHVTGLDPNLEWLAYARDRSPDAIHWVGGEARALPFPDRTFDLVVSVAALCFVDDEHRAAGEIVRVTDRRFAIGWLNRESLLFNLKGKNGGVGSYRGARWHRPENLLDLFTGLPVARLTVRSAVFLPSGSALARGVEKIMPDRVLRGGLIIVSGERLS